MILVTGATGFVGKKLVNSCRDCVAAPSLRNATKDDIKRILEEKDVDVIVHTAAISDIGACEKDPEASYYANVRIPVFLAEASEGRKLICFSSDQVYSGCDEEGPYSEEVTKPANTYARHKLEMEERVLDLCPSAVMLRAEWMYDYPAPRPNYYTNVLWAKERIAFSSAQYRGVTYLKEVAQNLEKVIHLPGGAYNFGSETNESMYDLTEKFLKYLGRDIGTDILLEDAPARHNLWMNCAKARSRGVVFSDVLDGLIRCTYDNFSR